MSDLISRSAVLKILSDEFDMAAEERAEADNEKDRTFNAGEINCARRSTRKVNELPALDAVPVVHSRWIDEIEPNAVTSSGKEVHFFRCSACNFTWNNKTAVLHYFRFCPNCGAKMDGEENASD